MTLPLKVEEIKDALMQDPNFEPMPGRTKEQSAYAVAWSRFKQMKKNEEVLSMGSKDDWKRNTSTFVSEDNMEKSFDKFTEWLEKEVGITLEKQFSKKPPGTAPGTPGGKYRLIPRTMPKPLVHKPSWGGGGEGLRRIGGKKSKGAGMAAKGI